VAYLCGFITYTSCRVVVEDFGRRTYSEADLWRGQAARLFIALMSQRKWFKNKDIKMCFVPHDTHMSLFSSREV